jgi:DNA-nicking Smr family endonuclease
MNTKRSRPEETEEIVEYPIDGILDLHNFAPGDVKSLVPAYLEECAKKGIKQVRIIHGKGKGILRQTVRSILKRHPLVVDYRTPQDGSSWGATIVSLGNRTNG